jgi:hypothetical protein
MFMVIRRVVTASANNIGTRQLTAKMGEGNPLKILEDV